MTSPHILTKFKFVTLQHSVRARGDAGLKFLQNIVRLHYGKHEESPDLIH